MNDRNAEKNNQQNQHHQDEISNISAGVFRRENNNNNNINHQQQFPSIHLNEYFAKNLNMAKLPSSSDAKMGRGGLSSSPTTSSSVRQMLPIALCLFTFASVLSMLIIYIDTTGGDRIYLFFHYHFSYLFIT